MKIYWKRENLRKKVVQYAQSNPITARRMKSIDSAGCFCDLRPASNGRAHFLVGKEYEGCFAIDLEKKQNGKRLICIPRGEFKMANGQYVEETIVELEIINIVDYH
jgi:hypothetical protein